MDYCLRKIIKRKSLHEREVTCGFFGQAGCNTKRFTTCTGNKYLPVTSKQQAQCLKYAMVRIV